jgi:hypothetical protein
VKPYAGLFIRNFTNGDNSNLALGRLAGRFGENISRTKTVEWPRLVSIVPLLAAPTQTQDSNVLTGEASGDPGRGG